MPHIEGTIPQVFISHASEDKDRFVREFVDRCRKDGIKCWFDEWEMRAGDSLVDKISAGLKESNIFAIVLSKNSIDKPWVKKELNTAIIKQIQKETKIIPLILDNLDDCEIPELLRELFHVKIHDLSSFESEFSKFKNGVFNISIKPPVLPVSAELLQPIIFTDLTPIDNLVLKTSSEIVLSENVNIVGSQTLSQRLHNSISDSDIQQSLLFLEETGYVIIISKDYLGSIKYISVDNATFIKFLSHEIKDFNSIFKKSLILIASEGVGLSNTKIASHFEIPKIVASEILNSLQDSGEVSLSAKMDGTLVVLGVSKSFERKMQNT